MAPPIDEQLLDDKLAVLEKARPWSTRVISKLEQLIRTGDDDSLYRINPVRFATEKGISERESIDLFLHATRIGLFQMDWQLICPVCAHVVNSFKTLDELHNEFQCNLCFGQFLSGKQLLSTQTFLDLFRSVTTPGAEGLGVKDLTYLFTDLKSSTGLYKAIGDPKAFYYFGQSVNIASRIQQFADANEIFISEDVYRAPGAKDALAAFVVMPQQASVKGVSAEMQLYKVNYVHPQTQSRRQP